MKRKLDSEEASDENHDDTKEFGKLNRAKNVSKLNSRVLNNYIKHKLFWVSDGYLWFIKIAISMAKRAGLLAREMKSMKSDLCFMQERCSILEEENRRLRDGFVKGVPPEEDDLVRSN